MARLAAYLSLMIGSLTFWTIELLLNYREYAGNNPFGLEDDFQKSFVLNRNHLLFSELAFPFGMVVILITLLIFKIAARPVRATLGFVLFFCMEFWMWRAYFFDGRVEIYYLQNEAKDPTLMLPHYFKEYMIVFGVLFLVVLLLKEFTPGTDADELNARLRNSLEERKDEVAN